MCYYGRNDGSLSSYSRLDFVFVCERRNGSKLFRCVMVSGEGQFVVSQIW